MAVTAHFHVPEIIRQGLDSGVFERVGGVVRRTGDRRIVAWLRELPGTQDIAQDGLRSISGALGVVNLAASVVGAAANVAIGLEILRRIDLVSAALEQLQEDVKAGFDREGIVRLRAAAAALEELGRLNRSTRADQADTRRAVRIEIALQDMRTAVALFAYDAERELQKATEARQPRAAKAALQKVHLAVAATNALAAALASENEAESAAACAEESASRLRLILDTALPRRPALNRFERFEDYSELTDVMRREGQRRIGAAILSAPLRLIPFLDVDALIDSTLSKGPRVITLAEVRRECEPMLATLHDEIGFLEGHACEYRDMVRVRVAPAEYATRFRVAQPDQYGEALFVDDELVQVSRTHR